MYIDAFVAAMQCEGLKLSLKHINMDASIQQDDTSAGSALLVCFDNF
jgi:hypothetical protein